MTPYKINFRFLLSVAEHWSTSSGISGLRANLPYEWWSSDINYYHVREDENCVYVEGEAYLEVLLEWMFNLGKDGRFYTISFHIAPDNFSH